VTAIKLLDQKLGLLYRRTTKLQPGELFARKTKEASSIPQYDNVVQTLEGIRGTINGNLDRLERIFSTAGTVNVRSERNGTPAEKEVSASHSVPELM